MPVVEDSDQVLPLLKVGDEVTTDEGPGVLVGVQFQTAQYNGKWELEPPQLEVDLDSGKTIYTCLCSIELPNTQKGTKLIHQEFDRLWPPRTEAVPEDADMLIPEGDEEPIREGLKEAKMNDYLKKELARYLEYVDAADRDELIKAFKRFFGLPLLKPISREEYERLGRELGIEVFPDDELGSYADKYGSYDFWTYGWLNDRLEMPLRQSRWFGLMREQPEPAQEPKRPTLEPQGQLWEQCEQCGEEPSYMPLHLCQRCWPNERNANMKRYAEPRKPTSLEELIDYAVDHAQGFNSPQEAEDYRHEAIEAALPVYYSQMVDLMRDTDLMHYPVGETFSDGTLVDAIQATLYEIISEGLDARWNEVEAFYDPDLRGLE